MPKTAKYLPLLAIALVLIFVVAQFHYCADLDTSPSGSHLCPVCAAATTIIVAQPPAVPLAHTSNRLVACAESRFVVAPLPRELASRPPPAA